jgi:phage protein D
MRFRPNYRLQVGDATVDSRQDISQSTLVRLDVRAGIDGLADYAELTLAPLGGIQAALGDELQIDLGFDDSLVRIFTGSVVDVISEVTALRVIGHSPVHQLLGLRVNKTYERMSSGDIVRDLAAQAQVRTGIVEAGIQYPAYVIDGQLSAARHIHRLAERSGFDAYVLPGGEIEFRKFTDTAPDQIFIYGQEILDYSLSIRPPRAAEVVVAGESAASSQGDDAASWLTRTFNRGRASGGRGEATVLVEDPAVRTTEGANIRATGVLRRLVQREKTGRLRALGRPELKLGDAFRVERAPDERLNDTFQVRAIHHHLSRKLGLITAFEFWKLP